VRLAKRADAEGIVIVINRAFRSAEGSFVEDDRVDLKGVLKLLDTGTFLLAESDGQLKGVVYVELRPNAQNDESHAHREHAVPEAAGLSSGVVFNSHSQSSSPKSLRAYLGLLAVDPARQHSGLGTLLMNAAEEYCRGLGAGFMDIKVVNLREELFGFYHRRGYAQSGTSAFPREIRTTQSCHFIEMSKPLPEDLD